MTPKFSLSEKSENHVASFWDLSIAPRQSWTFKSDPSYIQFNFIRTLFPLMPRTPARWRLNLPTLSQRISGLIISDTVWTKTLATWHRTFFWNETKRGSTLFILFLWCIPTALEQQEKEKQLVYNRLSVILKVAVSLTEKNLFIRPELQKTEPKLESNRSTERYSFFNMQKIIQAKASIFPESNCPNGAETESFFSEAQIYTWPGRRLQNPVSAQISSSVILVIQQSPRSSLKDSSWRILTQKTCDRFQLRRSLRLWNSEPLSGKMDSCYVQNVSLVDRDRKKPSRSVLKNSLRRS